MQEGSSTKYLSTGGKLYEEKFCGPLICYSQHAPRLSRTQILIESVV